jgi:hypothetical protein
MILDSVLFWTLSLDEPGRPCFGMSWVTDYRHGIHCDGSETIRSVRDIVDCPTNVRVVSITVEISFETSYEISKGHFGNVLCGLQFRKHLSWQGIALNGRGNEGRVAGAAVGEARNAHPNEAGTALAASNRNRNQAKAEVRCRHVKSVVPKRRSAESRPAEAAASLCKGRRTPHLAVTGP